MVSNRRKNVPSVLVGSSGPAAAVAAWTGIALLWVVAFFVGALIVPFVLAATMTAVPLTMRASSQWRAGRIIMTSALVLWATCTMSFWWLWGVGFDAADSFRPDPPVMVLYLPSLIIGSVAFAVFFLTLGAGIVRSRATSDPVPAPA